MIQTKKPPSLVRFSPGEESWLSAFIILTIIIIVVITTTILPACCRRLYYRPWRKYHRAGVLSSRWRENNASAQSSCG